MTTQRKLWAGGAILLATVLAFAGISSMVAYAQGPRGHSPCEGEGPWAQGSPMWGGAGGGMGMMGEGYGPHADEMDDADHAGRMGMMGRGGMMGGYGMGGMMDEDCPFEDAMMDGWPRFEAAGPVDSLEAARTLAERFVAAWEDDNLVLGEVMQFDNQFYAQAIERESGRGAFEFLIDPETGAVTPEHGPNMMWNARYGMHGAQGPRGMMGDDDMGGMMGAWSLPEGADGVEMPLSAEDAYAAAQAYLAEAYPGLSADEEATAFYGYYTLHILQDGEIVGMLSVNGYTGQVWLHSWHGAYIGMEHVAGEEHSP